MINTKHLLFSNPPDPQPQNAEQNHPHSAFLFVQKKVTSLEVISAKSHRFLRIEGIVLIYFLLENCHYSATWYLQL